MSAARETLDIDVLFVGAGPANLAAAYHLARLLQEHNAQTAGTPLAVTLGILEKGKEIGSHALSGAVVDPRALQELLPDCWQEAPFEAPVAGEKFLGLTASRAFSLPIPPPLRNQGKYVASLGKLLKWLASKVEAQGVDIFCEFPAAQPLIAQDNGKPRVVGVRTADRGLDHHGKPKSNHEPGVDINTQVVVVGEGPRGSLAKQLEAQFPLTVGRNPQVYALGIKEIWELPSGRVAPGEVIHTFGWPLDSRTFGGAFIYGMRDDQAIVGLVVGLNYENPWLDPHAEFQRLKTHPWMRRLLAGGKMLFYGAKALPEGGFWSLPRPWGDGFLLCGDSGGFLNSQRLKGIHLAMKSGMLAAETIFAALAAGGINEERLQTYEERIRASWIQRELWSVRNFHQAFDHGLLAGMFQAGIGMVTGGRGWGFRNRLGTEAGPARLIPLDSAQGRSLPRIQPPHFDGELTFDKLADVYNSGTAHEENQPVHLLVRDPEICVSQCATEFGQPCQRFCPASVYEIVDDPAQASGKRLQINASNCVHCKTCDILDPYQIIDWVPPEGGGGPNYGKM